MENLKVVFMPHPPIIIPEIGGGQERLAADTIEGMEKLGELIGQVKPDTIVFVSPHGSSFDNGTCILNKETIHGDFSAFGYPQINFEKKVNQPLAIEIMNAFEKEDFISVLMDESLGKQYGVKITLDNGVMVPMYFIDKYHSDYNIVHITPGFTSLRENYSLGQKIQQTIKKQAKSVLLLCSGDLSHALKNEGPYEFHPSGPSFDLKVKTTMIEKDPLSLLFMDEKFIEEAGQCGLRSFLMGFGFVDGEGYDSKVLSYEGPFGVGYLTGYFSGNKEIQEASLLPKVDELIRNRYEEYTSGEDEYIKLARMSVENYVKKERKLDFQMREREFSKEFIQEATKKTAGIFVSIHKNGALRGCIGTVTSTQDNIIEEIIYNSINASSDDPRFDAIEPNELFELDIKVDVLMDPEPITSKKELDVIQYGVIVEKGSKRGLLLPNLEGIDTVDNQVQIAMSKAGITDESGMKLYRFRVERHERK